MDKERRVGVRYDDDDDDASENDSNDFIFDDDDDVGRKRVASSYNKLVELLQKNSKNLSNREFFKRRKLEEEGREYIETSKKRIRGDLESGGDVEMRDKHNDRKRSNDENNKKDHDKNEKSKSENDGENNESENNHSGDGDPDDDDELSSNPSNPDDLEKDDNDDRGSLHFYSLTL